MGWRSCIITVLLGAIPATIDAQCTGQAGRVLDHLTGAPIAGARVTGAVDSSAVTDAEGCFRIDVYTEVCNPMLPDCGYRFAVSADGYVPYGENGYGPHPKISPFYREVRLAPLAAALCYGDCNDNDAVAIDELLCAVDALLTDAASGCTCADGDGDQHLHIAEVLAAVHNALIGCVACPTAPTFCGPLIDPPS
jgi:hypothetical protein